MKQKSLAEIKQILQTKTIGIAGAGGLGSNCAAALVRSGIGKLIIADFDQVETSNLNRQFYFSHQVGMPKVHALRDNLLAIDQSVRLHMHNIRLNSKNIPEIFADCDVLVEAFDRAEMKQELIESMSKYYPEMPLVIGSGMAGWGNSNQIKMEKSGNLYICGDQQNEISDTLPPLAPRVGIVAHMQANQVLEILL